MNKLFNAVKTISRLLRLPNLVILALSMYFVRYCIFYPIFDLRGVELQMGNLNFALLVLSTLLLAAGGYVINDYFDLDIDEVNRPEKVVLEKHISLKKANKLYYTLTIIGCLMGIYVAFMVGSLKLGFIHLVCATVLYYYSLKYKRIAFAGNITVALLAALSILIVWLFEFFAMKQNPLIFGEIVSYFSTINILVVGYALFALLLNLIREMVKDIEDIEGDRSFQCRTLPIVFGTKNMHRVIMILSGITALFIAFSSYKLFLWDYHAAGWYFAIVMGGLWIYYLTFLAKAKSKKDYHFLSTLLKINIVAGILSMQLLYASF